MKRNLILLILTLILVPIVVISFPNKESETNFNLSKKEQELTVKILVNDKVEELSLNDYIIGVLAGEMPASFEMEALKAQSVASRTYALYKKNLSNLEYDLTDDTSNQVYLTNEEMQKKWGSNYDFYYNKIKEAVTETQEEIITYKGDIIEAFYFSMSNGTTQNSEAVFGQSLDYLVSVESKYDVNLKNNVSELKIKNSDFIEKLNLSCESLLINKIEKYDSGYVKELVICDKSFKGTEIRSILNLRSASFDIELNEDNEEVNITTYGYGHGVGMSQYGANEYAKNGYSYDEILKHYYTGVEITSLKNV